jgi:nucleoside-diphosphate-sugar epimerase
MLTRLTGDIVQQACGLDRTVQELLVKEVDLIIHCAASTAFNACDDHYQRINVAGTAHVLALAGNAPFLHVSTAYVCGTQNGPIAESACLTGTEFANGYELSKARAEALVEHSGRPWLTTRPSIVVGSEADGRIRRFDSIYGAFKLLAEGKVRAIPAAADASLNLVPVDHVALALSALASGYQNFTGQHVHICSTPSLPVVDLIDAMASFPGLRAPHLCVPDHFSSEQLLRTERKLFEQMLKPYLPYFQRNPKFVVGKLERLTGLQSPTIDRAVIHRLIGYAISAGFLRAEAVSARPRLFSSPV